MLTAVSITGLFHGALAWGAWQLARRVRPDADAWTVGLAALTLAWTFVTVGLQGLGSLGLIGRGPLAVAVGLWVAIGLACRFLPVRGDTSGSGETSRSKPDDPIDWSSRIAWALTAWVGLSLTAERLIFWVLVSSDGPIYHLPFSLRWWQDGRLSYVPAPFGETAATYFPANGNLWFTWLITCWDGDRLARIGQMPFWVVTGLAIYASARRLQVGRSASILASCLFLTMTPLLAFSVQPNVDTIFVAGYALGIFFLIRGFQVDGKVADLNLAGLGLGLALGTKAPALIFVGATMLGVGALLLTGRRRFGNGGTWIRLAALGVGTLMPSGFWWVRNAWETGNPLYPLHLEVFGQVLLSGWYDREAMAFSKYYLPITDVGSAIDIVLSVVDARLMPLWIVGLIGVAWSALRTGSGGTESDRARTRGLAILGGWAFVQLVLYWLAIPYRTQQRFLFHALVLGALPVAALLDRAGWLRWTSTVLLAIHLVTWHGWPLAARGVSEPIPWDFSRFVPSNTPAVFPVIDLVQSHLENGQTARLLALVVSGVSATAGALLIGRGRGQSGGAGSDRDRTSWIAVVGWSLGVVSSLGGTSLLYWPWSWEIDRRVLHYDPGFDQDYHGVWLQLERATAQDPDGSTIAYAGTNLPYFLMGSDGRNRVRYVNIDVHGDWLMHDYHAEAKANDGPSTWPTPRPGWDRAAPDLEAWLANLRRLDVDWLVVARTDPTEGRHLPYDQSGYPIELAWVLARPEIFQAVEPDQRPGAVVRLFRVRFDRAP